MVTGRVERVLQQFSSGNSVQRQVRGRLASPLGLLRFLVRLTTLPQAWFSGVNKHFSVPGSSL